MYLGNLNDGPKDGEADKAKKPTPAPFESKSMYSGSAVVFYSQFTGTMDG